MLTSTEPCEEFRPTVTVLWRITNSKSLPSSRAKACDGGERDMDDAILGEIEEENVYTGGIEIPTGLQGADLRASRARAPVSSPKSAILIKKNTEGIASATAMCWEGSLCCCWWW